MHVHAGATAFDPEDGDLTYRILTCPPPTCMPFGCPGHEMRRKGIQGCGVDTATAAVGTLITFDIVVMDLSVPPVITRVTRVIRVVSPCAASEIYCPDLPARLTCGTTACPARAAASASDPAAAHPPSLAFTAAVPSTLISPLEALNSSSRFPQSLLDSLAAARVDNVVQMTVACGTPTPLALTGCPAPASADTCMVEARQAGAPMSGWKFTVAPVIDPACTSARMQLGECAACTAQAVHIGGCLPGTYAFVLTATAPGGARAAAPVAALVSVRASIAVGDVTVQLRVAVQQAPGQPAGSLEAAAADVAAEMQATSARLNSFRLALQGSIDAAVFQAEGSCGLDVAGGPEGGLSVEVSQAAAPGEIEVQSTAVDGGVELLVRPSVCCCVGIAAVLLSPLSRCGV